MQCVTETHFSCLFQWHFMENRTTVRSKPSVLLLWLGYISRKKNWKDPVYLTKQLIFAKGKCIVIKRASATAAALEYGQIRIAINVLFLYFHLSHSQNQNRWNGSKTAYRSRCGTMLWYKLKHTRTHAMCERKKHTHLRDNIYQFEVLCFEWNLHEIISLTKEIL